MKIGIITGGKIEDNFISEWLESHSYDCLIGVDRGLEFFYRKGMLPDVALGDFDSISPQVLSYFESQQKVKIYAFPPQKNATDTELAIDYAIEERNAAGIDLLGATGTRIDHLLGNLHSLYRALSMQVPCCMVDSCNKIELIQDYKKLEKKYQYGTYVSFIPFTTSVEHVKLKGFKYSLEDATFTIGHSIGISNEICDEVAEVSFTKGILAMIESKDETSVR